MGRGQTDSIVFYVQEVSQTTADDMLSSRIYGMPYVLQ